MSSPIVVGPRDHVFILTGAGISAESGVRTFRDSNGLWEEHRVEDVATPEGWLADAELVWRFYSQRRAQVQTVQPNAAHRALAELEEKIGDRLFLCTQNVDPLHERAGSRRVIHMHGELMKSRCERCDRPAFTDEKLYPDAASFGRCECGARHRPHVVWFGEVPLFLDEIAVALRRADHFVTIGSSGAVYPAAGFVASARQARSVYVGPEAPENARAFDEHRIGTATQVVPALFEVQ
jgi:NAD-dependent deacetylase